jgi:ABC-type antimicrobial peptide transport system permease subunit
MNRLGEEIQYLPSGDIDPVPLIFSNLTLDGTEGATRDPHGISISNFAPDTESDYYEEIKVIVPEGYRDVLSLDTKRGARICIGSRRNCKTAYKVKVRAMLTKIPGFFFTAYQSAQFFGQQLVSEKQYKAILEDYFRTNPGARKNFEDMISSYNFTEDVPKYKLFIKLAPNIDADRRQQIADGVRSYFRDEMTILLDLKDAMSAVNTSLNLFQVFVALVGFIALTLAFFLLLVSTTQNVKENIWEYGCLRAMGFTKLQGMRSFMYEQYAVIISSLFLGSLVGLIVAAVVTA